MRFALVTVVLLSLVPARPAWSQNAPSPAEIYALRTRAEAAYEAGSYAEAAELYGAVVAASPRDGEALFQQAMSLYRAGDGEAATRLATEAVERGFSPFPAGRIDFEIARGLAERGQSRAALERIERALAAGFEERPALKEDEAFERMRDDPRFRELAGFPPGEEPDRAARWRHDLDFFLEEARRLHADPGRVAHGAAFEERVDALKERVGELDDVAMAVELQRVVASLGDGHSVVYPVPTEAIAFPPPLPVSLWFFDDGLFVVRAAEPFAGLVGSRVVAIGGRPVAELVADLAAHVSRDNDQGILWLGPLYLTSTPYLRALGAADDLLAATLTVEGPDGARRDVELPASGERRLNTRLGPPPGAATGVRPRWLADVERTYGFEALPELDAVWLQFNSVRDAEGYPIEALAADVQAALAARGARHLILDLRHNNGGNNFLIWPIVRLVMWHEAEDPAHRVWVVTGRNTFSACQNLVNFLDRETGAVFVGEPSSSKPNFVGEGTRVELPYSELRLSISSRYWQDSHPNDERPYVPVEVPVGLTSDDYFGNRDPVLDALAEVLAAGG